uniref:UMOD/GP2/OIT3-like D8C domain-containing protein n=1 Tax=Denticeps clupeoides TaxID=299321 RepID=A0AAY3ZXX1_9TELE
MHVCVLLVSLYSAPLPTIDPCVNYTSLDQPWRATNYSTKSVLYCDNSVNWNGWYRLLYNGMNALMPESCVPINHCGTSAPLWITSAHPQVGDGVVSRAVCGNWNGNCCQFKPPSIQVKACVGNYYVYQFVKTGACDLAYCAGNNLLVITSVHLYIATYILTMHLFDKLCLDVQKPVIKPQIKGTV